MADEPDGKRQKGRANSKGNVEAIGQQNQSTERAAFPTISMMVTDEGRLRSRSHDEHMPPRPRGWSLDKITLNRPRAITVGSVAGQHRNLRMSLLISLSPHPLLLPLNPATRYSLTQPCLLLPFLPPKFNSESPDNALGK